MSLFTALFLTLESADDNRGAYSMFDRDFDLGEARKIGFTESVDHVKGYHIAFDRMKAAKIIPYSSADMGAKTACPN